MNVLVVRFVPVINYIYGYWLNLDIAQDNETSQHTNQREKIFHFIAVNFWDGMKSISVLFSLNFSELFI